MMWILGLWTGARKLFGLVPKQVWVILAIAAVVGIVIWWHGHEVHRALEGAHQRGVDETNTAWQHRLDQAHQEAAVWRWRWQNDQDVISQRIGTQHAQDLRRITAGADALRLRGPGAAAAACPGSVDRSTLAGPSGGSQPPAGHADDGGPRVPTADRATVPWGWLVGRTEQCDANTAEARSWREWNEQQRRLNETMRTAGADQPGG